MSGYDFDSDEAKIRLSTLSCIGLFRGKLFPAAEGIRVECRCLSLAERVESLRAHYAPHEDLGRRAGDYPKVTKKLRSGGSPPFEG